MRFLFEKTKGFFISSFIKVKDTILSSYRSFLATPDFLLIISLAIDELNVTLSAEKVSKRS